MAALDRALGAAHGISLKEFDVLITLFNAPNGRLRMTALAESVLLTASGLTHLVTRLELKGLVSRDVDEGDRRSFLRRSPPPASAGCENPARPTMKWFARA